MYIENAKVILWDKVIGYLSWSEKNQYASFQYDEDFIQTGISPSPLIMPLSNQVYQFPELRLSETFCGLPGLLADSLPETYGNGLMKQWLSRQGIRFSDLNPVERLCYLGTRAMGALEFQPNYNKLSVKQIPLKMDELVNIAREIMQHHNNTNEKLSDIQENQLNQLIQVGTSAGGAKAKAIIALREIEGKPVEIMSGQGKVDPDLSYWIMKFSGVRNSEHLSDQNIGRLEYAYYQMAKAAGIKMMESRLYEMGEEAHFMTKRFDRIKGYKIHIQTYCSLAHEDRNPVGNTSYEILFATARKLGLGQQELDELYLRMVFNILARNQDDHSKNHAFMMDAKGKWKLTPAYDIIFSYKKGSQWIALQQMCCNGKRDHFTIEDLLEAGKAADISNPMRTINQVKEALESWEEFGTNAGLKKSQIEAIRGCFRVV